MAVVAVDQIQTHQREPMAVRAVEQDALAAQILVGPETPHPLVPRKDQTAEITALAHPITALVAVVAHLLWVRTELVQLAATAAQAQPHLFLAAA
jgi:hypothetical protein